MTWRYRLYGPETEFGIDHGPLPPGNAAAVAAALPMLRLARPFDAVMDVREQAAEKL